MPVVQLKHYFFTELSAKPNPEFIDDAGPNEHALTSDSFEFEIGYKADDESESNIFLVHLLISTKEEESSPGIPLLIKISLLGSFIIEDESILKNDFYFALENMCAILYGAARDRILSITGQMPFGPLILPTHTFALEDLSFNETTTP